MTALFDDIHRNDTQNLIPHRVPGAQFDEILYADDTTCISQDARAMNMFRKSIEEEGRKYGLKLNKTKCETVYTGTPSNIHFGDGTLVPRTQEAKYSGCMINMKGSVSKELSKRMSDCFNTLIN